MPRKTPRPSSTRHLLLFDEDWEYLESRFGSRGIKPVGVSTVIRAILHQKIMALRAAEIEMRDRAHSRVTGAASGTFIGTNRAIEEEYLNRSNED